MHIGRKAPAAHLCGILIPEGLEQPVVLLLAGLWAISQALAQVLVSMCRKLAAGSPCALRPGWKGL